MAQMTHAEIKDKMIWAGKVLVNEGQDDFTRGHISMRLPDNPKLFFMKCHSVGLDEITAENILTIDLEGNVVAGTSRRHSEVYIHSEIFKVRPDVHCILHTHPLYSIVWSGGGRPLKAISQPAALFHNAIGIYTDTINLIRSHEMGAGVAKALGPHSVVMLKNHGIVTAAPTIEEMVIRTIMFENAAQSKCSPKPPATSRRRSRMPTSSSSSTTSAGRISSQVNFDYLMRRAKRRER